MNKTAYGIIFIIFIAGLFLFFREFRAPETQSQSLSAIKKITTQEKGIVIRMTEDGFLPSEISIKKGDTVIFENTDTNPHWPASDVHPTHDRYPEFDPKEPIASGESWSFVFEKQGRWQSHDHLHPAIRGVITVE